jgi:hypothetical protein
LFLKNQPEVGGIISGAERKNLKFFAKIGTEENILFEGIFNSD